MKFVSEPAKYNNLSTGVPPTPIDMTFDCEIAKYNNLSTGECLQTNQMNFVYYNYKNLMDRMV